WTVTIRSGHEHGEALQAYRTQTARSSSRCDQYPESPEFRRSEHGHQWQRYIRTHHDACQRSQHRRQRRNAKLRVQHALELLIARSELKLKSPAAHPQGIFLFAFVA